MGGVLAVADGAILRCSKGDGLSRLCATVGSTTIIENKVLATIMDNIPGVNVIPFPHCRDLGGPCVPVFPAPWQANIFSAVLVSPSVAGILPISAQLRCTAGSGDVTVVAAGQSTLSVGQAENLIALQEELNDLYGELQATLASGGILTDAQEALLRRTGMVSGALDWLARRGRGWGAVRDLHNHFVPTREKLLPLYLRYLRRNMRHVNEEIRRIKGSPPIAKGGRPTPVPSSRGDHIPRGSAPPHAQRVINHIDNHGGSNGAHPLPWYKGGKPFDNDGRNGSEFLPRTDPHGNPITYREWDVHPKSPRGGRGQERVVTGSDGSVYYTDGHYKKGKVRRVR